MDDMVSEIAAYRRALMAGKRKSRKHLIDNSVDFTEHWGLKLASPAWAMHDEATNVKSAGSSPKLGQSSCDM